MREREGRTLISSQKHLTQCGNSESEREGKGKTRGGLQLSVGSTGGDLTTSAASPPAELSREILYSGARLITDTACIASPAVYRHVFYSAGVTRQETIAVPSRRIGGVAGETFPLRMGEVAEFLVRGRNSG
ncbi:Hypothetical protein NTJ_08655 [Nesidiocoris tenuis]|uniref:Uncharacterized protein n=1 Tax=Nesidiocoris tenuis TaxID=355587 RepID=A0ABN7AUI7_9HEMI|nr:Hypothetical protein NTJ_08655 [Nesidiocoris tenuis]